MRGEANTKEDCGREEEEGKRMKTGRSKWKRGKQWGRRWEEDGNGEVSGKEEKRGEEEGKKRKTGSGEWKREKKRGRRGKQER